MDELIYRFLLQAGYPRASIVGDLSLLPLAGVNGADAAAGTAPAFAIVDPDTADRLALVDGIDAVDGDALREAAGDLGHYARRFGGQAVQAFLMRIDPHGTSAEEQVQFYRVWPDATLRQLSVKSFPDLASLRTHQLLVERRTLSEPGAGTPADAPAGADSDAWEQEYGDAGPGVAASPVPSAGRVPILAWVPGAALALFAVIDWTVMQVRGEGIFSVVQALLLIGAATLLLVTASGAAGGRPGAP